MRWNTLKPKLDQFLYMKMEQGFCLKIPDTYRKRKG